MSTPAPGAAAPRPGSIHYFVELYAPAAQRPLLRHVHELDTEIRASLVPTLDHGVAHARLDWWQLEAARAAAGSPTHPLLRPLLARCGAAVPGATLTDWVMAARLQLAGGLSDQRTREEHARLSLGAGFALAAALLAANVAAARELGAALAALHLDKELLDAPPTSGDATWHAARRATGSVAPRDQPALRPLLVWAALALRRAARGAPAPPDAAVAAPLALLGDNLLAWRAARAADGGRVHALLAVSP